MILYLRSFQIDGDSSEDSGSKGLFEINLELRRRLEEEHNEYRKKLQSFQESQQKQGQLVQRLQKKVSDFL